MQNISATKHVSHTHTTKMKNTQKIHNIPKNLVNFDHFIANKYEYQNLAKLQFYATLFQYHIIVNMKHKMLFILS